MDMTERSGQPSMEEILASIRRIIAEEPADSISLDFKPRSNTATGQSVDLDDSSDFELPSMFRASTGTTNGSSEKSSTTSGKLMDALRATPQLDTSANGRAEALFPLPASFNEFASQPFDTRSEVSTSSSPLTGLSSLRPTARAEPPPSELFGRSTQAFAMPLVETVSTDPANRVSWAVEAPIAETPAPIASAPSAPVVRQMVPFRDQHFTRMCLGSAPEAAAPAAVAPSMSAPVPQLSQAPSFATLAFNSATPPPLTQIADVPALSITPPSLTGAIKAAEAAASGPIEDATAELLRPMLRQWLSENMPRMVEKALHIEVAESIRPGKKPGST